MTPSAHGRGTQRHVEHCMGTVFSFDIRPPGVDASVIAEAVKWLHWVDRTFSTYKPTRLSTAWLATFLVG